MQYRFVNSTHKVHFVECEALVCLWLLKRRFRWSAVGRLFKFKMMPRHAQVTLKIKNCNSFGRKQENVVTHFSKLRIIQS